MAKGKGNELPPAGMDRRVGGEDKGVERGDVDALEPREQGSRHRRGRASFSTVGKKGKAAADRWGRGKNRAYRFAGAGWARWKKGKAEGVGPEARNCAASCFANKTKTTKR